jgi:hypothetical protein
MSLSRKWCGGILDFADAWDLSSALLRDEHDAVTGLGKVPGDMGVLTGEILVDE